MPKGYHLDVYGNIRSAKKCEIRGGKLYITYHYVLEKGKTTLRGEYPKLADPPKCAHPERLSCNYGDGFERCEFMKHVADGWAAELLEDRVAMPVGTFTAVLHKEADLYLAECPEVGTVSQGKTVEEAVANLKEATELYLEEFPPG